MKHTSTQSGFSLVETLVAITILLIIIVGPMTISSSAARSTSFSSEQVVAFFLAQEGAEIVQKGRDDLLLEDFADPDTAWSNFIDTSGGTFDSCFSSNGCGVELNTDSTGSLKTPVACSGTNCKLYFDSAGDRSRYTHTAAGNTATPYTRTITMEATANREVKVTSRVSWRTGSQRNEQEVLVETYLFNVYGI